MWKDQGGAGEMEGSAQCNPSLGQLLRPGAGFPGLSRSVFGTFWADSALTTVGKMRVKLPTASLESTHTPAL